MPKFVINDQARKDFKEIDNSVFSETEELKKFNLKISTRDLDLISFLANKRGVSKNKYLDEIINSIILGFLSDLERNDSILLIEIVDLLNNTNVNDNIQSSWISDLYPPEPYSNEMMQCLTNKEHFTDLSPGSGIASSDRSETYKHMLNLILNSKFKCDLLNEVKGE